MNKIIKIRKKQLKKIISEQLEQEKKLSAENIKEIMENHNALDELSAIFSKKIGISPKFRLTRNGEDISIFSDENLIKYTGSLGKVMFKEINIELWTMRSDSKDTIFYSPHVRYTHPGGGSNGIGIIANNFGYNYIENKWIIGHPIK